MYRANSRQTRSVLPSPAVLGPAGLPAVRSRRKPRATPPGWRDVHRGGLVAGDAVCALLATVVGLASPFAPSSSWPVLLVLPPLWVAGLLAARRYDEGALDEALVEFRRIAAAAALVLAAAALVAWGWDVDVSRGFVALTLPLAVLLTLAARAVRRRVVSPAPAAGRHVRTVLLIGDRSAAASLLERFARRAAGSWHVVGYCLPTRRGVVVPVTDPPVLGGLGDAGEVVRRHHVDTVVVLPSAGIDGAGLEDLVQRVNASGSDLLVASALTDVIAARRASIETIGGLRLLHVGCAPPKGPRRPARAMLDRVVAALLIVLVAPVLLAVAVALALDRRGPVFVREAQVGPDGRVFSMLRFRADDPGSDGQLTRVGGLLRRGCVDELPRLFDVLRGDARLPWRSLRRRPGQNAVGSVPEPRGTTDRT